MKQTVMDDQSVRDRFHRAAANFSREGSALRMREALHATDFERPGTRFDRFWPLTRRQQLALAAAVALIVSSLLTTGAWALSQWTRHVVVSHVSASTVRIGNLARTATIVSLQDARKAADYHIPVLPGNSQARLIRVELLSPITEIQGLPVVAPKPSVRLTYRLNQTTITIQEDQLSLPPGVPWQAVVIGSGPGAPQVERVGGWEGVVIRTSTHGVVGVGWVVGDTGIAMHFSVSTDLSTAVAIASSLR
jgi:hypothetical protein